MTSETKINNLLTISVIAQKNHDYYHLAKNRYMGTEVFKSMVHPKHMIQRATDINVF